MRRCWLAVPLLMSIASPVRAADPSPYAGIGNLRFEYYDVEGRTPREIYRSLMNRGPNNGQHWGITRSQSHDRWRTLTEGSSCRIVDAGTNLKITVLLPRHVAKEEMTEEGAAFWQSVYERIRLHEAGHARIAWEHRNDFRRAAAKANCRNIERVAKEVGDKVRARQEAFDRETDYGRKGAPRLVL